MRLSTSQIVAIKRETERFFGVGAQVWLFGSRVDDKQRGFTLVELIMTMVIVGILAAVVAPRFFDTNVFQTRGITDQIQASLRYAQKVAIAQRTPVSLNLTTGADTNCGTDLVGGNVLCQIELPPGVTITPAPPQAFTFNGLGRPLTAVLAVQVTGGGATNTITIEPETGYVHQ